MWRKSGTKLQGRYPATPSGGFMLGLDEFVYLAKSNLNLTIWLVQMHSKLASLVRNNIWTCQIVKFALDFAKNTNPSRPSINPPVGVAGSVLIYIIRDPFAPLVDPCKPSQARATKVHLRCKWLTQKKHFTARKNDFIMKTLLLLRKETFCWLAEQAEELLRMTHFLSLFIFICFLHC